MPYKFLEFKSKTIENSEYFRVSKQKRILFGGIH